MSDQSYDRVRQQIKNLGLKHKGGGSYERDGKYYGRVTKQSGQYILKRAGKTIPGKEYEKGSKPYDKKDIDKVRKVIDSLKDPDFYKSPKEGEESYDRVMKAYDSVVRKDDKKGQKLLQKLRDLWKKKGSLGGGTKDNKHVWPASFNDINSHLRRMGTKGDDETGPETDVKDEPKSIDKVTKKTYEIIITIPYENTEGGGGQGNDDFDDDEEQPEDVEIIKKIKAADEEEAQARADVEADEAFEKLDKKNKYNYHKPDYDMMNVEVEQISESYERKIMVKENINKFVNSLEIGDNKQAKEDLKNALADKVTSALDDAKTDVARSMFTGQVGADAPEANPFTGNDIEAETPAPEVASDEVAQ